MTKTSSKKLNILLIVLIFVIPLVALNFSFLFITIINYDWEVKKQEKDAIHKAETLSVESNFNTEFAIHFKEFFDQIQKEAKSEKTNETFLANLKQSAKQIFEAPFPSYNLYVFKIPNKTTQAELIYYEGSLNTGKKTLCKAFEHLYNVNIGNKDINEGFAKSLLGKNTKINAIAQDMRGLTTNTNSLNKASWFIWDYTNIDNKGVFGAILLCDELENQAKYGRLLALKRFKSNAEKHKEKVIGAFIPVYKDYGESIFLPPLDKSKLFQDWANSLIIKDKEKLDYWLKEPLPQNYKLGNYSAFCYLDRNSSHIAIVLVKSIKMLYSPKWLIIINLFLLLTLLIILYCGLCFDTWPQLKLRTRFIIFYALASVVPLSLLSVTAYGYLLEFEYTQVEKANNELQLSLKTFDSYKLTNIREYKLTFKKAISDPKLIELIKEEKEGIKSKKVTDYVFDIFENNELPIIGVKIYDETGEGGFSTGSASSTKDIKTLFNSLNSVNIDILRDEIKKENPNRELKEYIKNEENDFAEKAYFSLAGRELKIDMGKYFGVPIPRKNGDFCGYQIFDTIKINGETKYLLQVLWDDKTLDEKIIKKAIENNILVKINQNDIKSNRLINLNQNFIAYKINGLNLKPIRDIKRLPASQNLINKITEFAKQSSYFKKTASFEFDNNIIVVMPALNFNQIIFVGWVDKINIISMLFNRTIAFIILILISFIILLICSLRSSSVFLKPITLLKKALDEVSSGNLNIGFKDNPNNELGELSNEFDKMIEELREKERLSKLISDQAVQALKKNSTGLLNDTETFKGVALVSDIRNFTGMSEKYDPVIITELLNEHFAEMAKIISDNGGLIYKFIGDAIEAVFPEKSDFENSSSERAFKAGCMMISKLKIINSRRKKIGLFPYKIGIGLCHGIMYSGTVGSLETRLDYSILGDPLKNAAKYEALTIQNPDFPLTVDEFIAEKMAQSGLAFRKIDSNGQNFKIYTLDEIGVISNSKFSSSPIDERKIKENKENIININYFSLSNNSSLLSQVKDQLFYSFFVIIISLLITFGIKFLYDTNYTNLKADSDKYAVRLCEQLKCDAVLKSSFETVCLEFYDDLKKNIKNTSPDNLKNKIEQIALKYEKLGVPIPKYCCCFLDENIISKTGKTVYKGFSNKITDSMYSYTKLYKEYIDNNKDKEKDIERENLIDLGEELMGESISSFTNIIAKFYDFQQGVYFRRSSPTNIDNEEIILDTERIYDESQDNLIAYIFCGMPENIDKEILPNYYTLLAGNQMLLAIKNDRGWYFSPDFPENEKKLFLNNYNYQQIKNKGYYNKDNKKIKIEINEEPFEVYIISKDLYSNYYSSNKLIIITFILSILIISFIFWFFEKNKKLVTNSISSILRKEIVISAIMPLLTVCFLSYLYIVEESDAKKTDLILNINQQMNELENKEFYYSPLCQYYLNNLPNSKDIHNSIINIMNTNDKERNKECEKLSNYLKLNISGRNYIKKSLNLKSVNPFFVIKEIMIIGKDDWKASAKHSEKDNKENSAFGDLFSEMVKYTYLNKNNTSIKKDTSKSLKGELISEEILNVLSSAYGSDVGLKLTNLPNNLLIISSAYSSIGLYIGCFPQINNPDYAIAALIYFDNEFKPYICNNKNESIISYKTHLASDSMDDKLFCFYSPNLNVGEFFFHDGWYINHKEELQTVKELGLAASWINSSYIPLSKKIYINGNHYLEAKQGNHVKDNVYAGLGSDYPIKKNIKQKLYHFGLTILFSLIMIFLIAQSIISDLLNPVEKLINGAIEASKENYSFRTNFSRKDELGVLCDSFDKMMKGLEEKQLMNRMVSKTALKVASNLSDTGSKKVDVALLYVTVPGFDKIMKTISPIELFTKLRQQIAVISEIVINNGGDIDKIMGEKLLVAFRIGDKTPEEVAVSASRTASLIENCKNLSFKVSVGVNYGQVISGYLGVGEKRDFTIIGDPVNVTARIAVFAEKLESNRCIASEAIKNLVSNNLKTEEYGEILFKGKTKPAKVYRIV